MLDDRLKLMREAYAEYGMATGRIDVASARLDDAARGLAPSHPLALLCGDIQAQWLEEQRDAEVDTTQDSTRRCTATNA